MRDFEPYHSFLRTMWWGNLKNSFKKFNNSFFTKVLFVYSNYFIAQLGIVLTRINHKMTHHINCFHGTYPKFKDFLVVMVTVML